MVGDDQQVGRCTEGGMVVGQEARVHMSVGADDGKVSHGGVQFHRDPPLGRIRIKISVFG
jgi:hypothetical protein